MVLKCRPPSADMGGRKGRPVQARGRGPLGDAPFWRTVGRSIPWWVARQQSPPPFPHPGARRVASRDCRAMPDGNERVVSLTKGCRLDMASGQPRAGPGSPAPCRDGSSFVFSFGRACFRPQKPYPLSTFLGNFILFLLGCSKTIGLLPSLKRPRSSAPTNDLSAHHSRPS